MPYFLRKPSGNVPTKAWPLCSSEGERGWLGLRLALIGGIIASGDLGVSWRWRRLRLGVCGDRLNRVVHEGTSVAPSLFRQPLFLEVAVIQACTATAYS